MQADMDDTPGYLGKTFRQKLMPWVIPGLLGTATCLGLLYGAAALLPTSLRVGEPAPPAIGPQSVRSQPQPDAQSETALSRANRLNAHVDQAPALDDRRRQIQINEQAPVPGESPRQTVFDDGNYVPRGAVNSVSMRSSSTAPQSRGQDRLVVKGIREQRRVKDYCPDPSSIAGRNCRQSLGLGVRNR
jgi:hypothetical protein